MMRPKLRSLPLFVALFAFVLSTAGCPGTPVSLCPMLSPPGPSVSAGNNPRGIAVAPNGQFAYVTNADDNSVSQYAIDACGGLVPLSTPTVAAGARPHGIVIVDFSAAAPARYAYVTNRQAGTVSQYSVSASGELVPLSPPSIPTAFGPDAIAVRGRNVYVANHDSAKVSQYVIGAGGGLVPLSPATVSTGVQPSAIAIDPAGQFAYVTNGASNTVSQYSIAPNGALTPLSPSTLSAGIHTPRGIAVDPSGQFVYVANVAFSEVTMYSITASGTLAPLASPYGIIVGAHTHAVAIDPTGAYVYAANNYPGYSNLSQFSVDATGHLAALSPVYVDIGPGGSSAPNAARNAIAIDPSGLYVYVTNSYDNTVYQYSIGASGELDPL